MASKNYIKLKHAQKILPNTFDTCTQKANMTEGNYENVSINKHLQDDNTQSDIESILNFTDTEMFSISTSIDTIDSTSPNPILNSTASLIETKCTNSQCPNVYDTESQSGEKEIDGNTSQKNLSQAVLARHALETKRVEIVASMSAFEGM